MLTFIWFLLSHLTYASWFVQIVWSVIVFSMIVCFLIGWKIRRRQLQQAALQVGSIDDLGLNSRCTDILVHV